jgi:uncharacterized paraquat-inducible protein A
MTDASCASCGTTDGTVRLRRWHELDVALCARCYASLTGDHGDHGVGFTLAWAVLVTGLLLVAAGAATYLLTR